MRTFALITLVVFWAGCEESRNTDSSTKDSGSDLGMDVGADVMPDVPVADVLPDVPPVDAPPLLNSYCTWPSGGGGGIPCTKQVDCDSSDRYCNTTLSQCAFCLENSHCKDVSRPYCQNKFYCVQCQQDDHCVEGTGNTGLCDTKTLKCERCETDAECVDSGLGKYCDENCYPCKDENQDCVDAKLGKICMFMECWQCSTDADCDKGVGNTGKCKIEMSLVGSCTRCETHADCIDAQLGGHCGDRNTCEPCSADAHCKKGTENTGFCYGPDRECTGCETLQDCKDAFPEKDNISCASL